MSDYQTMPSPAGEFADLKRRIAALESVAPRSAVVTSLPSSPYDGQEISYLADAANAVIWRFRYKAASASAYKWEFIGGTPKTATANGPGNTAITLNVWTSVGGPIIAVPLAGDYLLSCSGSLWCNFGVAMYIGVYAVGQGGIMTQSLHQNSPAGAWHNVGHTWHRQSGINPQNIETRMLIDASGTQYNNNLMLAVQPVRVG